MKKYFLIPVVLIFSNSFTSNAQPVVKQQSQLNAYFNFLNNAGFSGQVLVAEKGKLLYRKDFGYANKETLYPVSSTTSFNIGSLTKQFTATAILLLEQDGMLSTSDTLGKFWDTLSAEKKAISIHQLLTHTGGFQRQAFPTADIVSKNELLNKIFTEPLQRKPGTSFQYSNAGYEVLAAIIEKISGLPYKDFIRKKFIIPYGLTHTYFNTDDLFNLNHKIAIGYNEWKEINYPVVDLVNWNNTGASNILSTDNDMYNWFSLITSDKILSAVQTRKLFTPFTKTGEEEEYGYGWYITKTDDDKKLIYHGGDLSGFHSELLYYPENNRVVYIITNNELFGYGISKYRIEAAIPKILSGKKIDFPLKTIKIKTDALNKYCGAYELDSANSFKVWNNGGQLTIAAWGQTAINLLLSKKEKPGMNLDSVSEKSAQLIYSVIAGKDEIAKNMLSPENFEIYYPPLKEKYNGYSNVMGGNAVVSIGGTIPVYWRGGGIYRTYIKLKFPAGNNTFYMGWGPRGIYDVTANDDRPFPLIYPIVFLADNKYVVYDIDHSNATAIEFTRDQNSVVKNLSIKDDNGSIILFKKIK